MARTKKTEEVDTKTATKRKPRTTRKTKQVKQEAVQVAANTGLYYLEDGVFKPVKTKAAIFDIVPSTEELKVEPPPEPEPIPTTEANLTVVEIKPKTDEKADVVESALSSGREQQPVKTMAEFIADTKKKPVKEEPVIVPAQMSPTVEPRPQPVAQPKKESNISLWIVIGIMALALLYSNRTIFKPFILWLDSFYVSRTVDSGEKSPMSIVDKTATNLTGDALTKVRNIKSFYLQADTADGKIVLRTGGNITWRYHNPGRVNQGDYAKANGAIGGNGEVAIFPTYDMGKKAVYELLFNPDSEYSKRSVAQSFVANKLSYIIKKSGVDKNAILKDLSASEQDSLFNAIQAAEGFTEGKVSVFEDEADFKKRGW